MKHELLEEVWRIRDEIGAECGHEVEKLAAMLRREEDKHRDRIVHLPIRRVRPEAAAALREEPVPYGRGRRRKK